jgi:hypothetical protein
MTAVVGLQLDDLKWAVSIAVSVFGSAVALYIFRGERRAHFEMLDRLHAELRHRTFPPNGANGDMPIDGNRASGK